MERLLAIWIEALCEEAPDGSTLRDHLALLDALSVLCPFTESVRLGLFVLPIRGPSRFFGGEAAVMENVRATIVELTGHEPSLGIADGLFCAEMCARRALVLEPGATESFRRSLPLSALGRKDVATTCQRLGLHTVGSFADLDIARVGERFNKQALVLQRIARGELFELDGQRDLKLATRLRQLRGEEDTRDEQLGFFGQRGAGDDRAEAAAHRVRRRLGVDAVVVAGPRGPCSGGAVGFAEERHPRRRAVAGPDACPVAGHVAHSSGGGATARRKRPPGRHGRAGISQ